MKRKIIVGVLCGVIAVLLCITGILIGKLCKKSAVTSVGIKIRLFELVKVLKTQRNQFAIGIMLLIL